MAQVPVIFKKIQDTAETINFSTILGDTYTNALTMSNGCVGVGTDVIPNSTHKLHVQGNINFTGNLLNNGVAFTSGGGGGSGDITTVVNNNDLFTTKDSDGDRYSCITRTDINRNENSSLKETDFYIAGGVTPQSTRLLAKSINGTTWSEYTPTGNFANNKPFLQILWFAAFQEFFAIADMDPPNSINPQRVYRSTNGVVWSEHELPGRGQNIFWRPKLIGSTANQVLIFGDGGATTIIVECSNSIEGFIEFSEFRSYTTTGAFYRDSVEKPDIDILNRNMYAISGDEAKYIKIQGVYTTQWTTYTLPASLNNPQSIAFSPELNKLVVVGNDGYVAVATPDPLIQEVWTLIQIPDAGQLVKVLWISGPDVFLTHSNNTSIHTSYDGLTWILQVAEFENFSGSVHQLVWSPTYKELVGLSESRPIVYSLKTSNVLKTVDGRVGIATALPTANLHVDGLSLLRNTMVDGSITLHGALTNDILESGVPHISVQGNVVPILPNKFLLGKTGAEWVSVHATNGTIQTSDERLKTGIQEAAYGLSLIEKLRPVSYKWKDPKIDGGRVHYGFLAQQVKETIDAVGMGDFAGWHLADPANPQSSQSLSYTQFIAPLCKAVQELAAQNAELRARIEKLEATK
jgi:hypothetical protein